METRSCCGAVGATDAPQRNVSLLAPCSTSVIGGSLSVRSSLARLLLADVDRGTVGWVREISMPQELLPDSEEIYG
jgi:hypothetical protein